MTSFKIVILVLACTSAFAKIEDAEFHEWMTKYNIQLDDPEEVYPVWKKNAEFVQKHNSLASSYKVSLNQFAHMTPKELVGETVFQLRIEEPKQQSTASRLGPLPPSIDWRKKGAVTPVKDQGQCGSAAAFAIVDSVNSYGFFENGKLEETSIEEYVDCCMNGSCVGGFFDVADYNCIARYGGLACNYPVTANHTCRAKDVKPCVAVKGGNMVKSGDEMALAEALLKQPIAVAIDASHVSFQMYASGVYYEPSCSSTRLDHAVLLVGYGTEDGKDYWLIKNSWGASWGMEGYAMMSRNRDNNCGIATDAIYPF